MDNQIHSTVYAEDDVQQSGGGWWIHKIGIIVYIAVIVAYAIQTLELVSWLFPSDNPFMKVVTVFTADGMATGWALCEMFYKFRLRKSKHLAFGMWVITFILSTCATVVQMYLSSTHNIPHKIDPNIITVAYGLVILAFVVNIISITVIIRMEHAAGQPKRVYLDDVRTRRAVPPVRVVEQAPSRSMVAASKDQVLDPSQVKPQVDAEPKQLKPSLADRIWAFRDAIDQRIDGDDKPILEEKNGESRTRRLGGSEEFEKQEDFEESDLPENYLDWSDTQWKAAKEQLSKEQYDELFDEAFPADGLKPTPVKKPAARTKKKVVRRTKKS